MWPFETVELGNKIADGNAMVKEYRKEAAGKTTPLASSVRPLPVLLCTMRYLNTRVIDLFRVEGRYTKKHWNEYIQDRLRSILKDLRTQQLCELGAVQVLENILRYSIVVVPLLMAHLEVEDFKRMKHNNEKNLQNNAFQVV